MKGTADTGALWQFSPWVAVREPPNKLRPTEFSLHKRVPIPDPFLFAVLLSYCFVDTDAEPHFNANFLWSPASLLEPEVVA